MGLSYCDVKVWSIETYFEGGELFDQDGDAIPASLGLPPVDGKIEIVWQDAQLYEGGFGYQDPADTYDGTRALGARYSATNGLEWRLSVEQRDELFDIYFSQITNR